MRQLAILGADLEPDERFRHVGSLPLEGQTVRFAMMEVADPPFDPARPENAGRVLVRVLAFSLNYRDRALMLAMTRSPRTRGHYVVGSDFVAEVLAVAPDVEDLLPGDLVISDNAYPDSGVAGLAPGVATNHASKELLVLHRRKLARAAPGIPLELLGGFSIGAQTAYAMVRRLALAPGERVLLAAPVSNTALFCAAALRDAPVELFGLTTGAAHVPHLETIGFRKVFVARRVGSGVELPREVFDHVAAQGPFHAMIDPFADVYLPHAPQLLGPFGRYVTCGVMDQHSGIVGRPVEADTRLAELVLGLMVRNIRLEGNCIGLSEDLSRALSDAAAGRFAPPVDSVHGEEEVRTFLERTYLDPGRFGKVVMRYAPAA